MKTMGQIILWLAGMGVTIGACNVVTNIEQTCLPNSKLLCVYAGPNVTENVGVCHAGTTTCREDGTWSPCEGDVTPQPENCATPEDEDCDGTSLDDDEGCVCLPGMASACYEGPPNTVDVGICASGIHVCNADGKGFGACIGQQVPETEECYSSEDENCDGASGCSGMNAIGKSFGDALDQDRAYSIAMAPNGDVIISAGFMGSVQFGGNTLGSKGMHDVAVARFDADLNHLWSKSFGNENEQDTIATAVDRSGNVILAGCFQDRINFGGSDLVSAGNTDVFLAKLNAAGEHLWSTSIKNSNAVRVAAVTTDHNGNIIIVGRFNESLEFDTGNIASAGNSDLFIAKYSHVGAPLWLRHFGGPGEDASYGVAVDGSDNIVMTGFVTDTVDFGNGPISGAGAHDVVVAKLTPNGEVFWVDRFGDLADQAGVGIVADHEGNILVSGSFFETIDFGGNKLVSESGEDGFLVKFDASGSHVWSSRLGGNGSQFARKLAVDSRGNVVVVGGFEGGVQFGAQNETSAGSYDALIAKFDPAGGYLWSRGGGDAREQYATDVVVDNRGNAYVVGVFEGVMQLGNDKPLQSKGSFDIFLAKLAP